MLCERARLMPRLRKLKLSASIMHGLFLKAFEERVFQCVKTLAVVFAELAASLVADMFFWFHVMIVV